MGPEDDLQAAGGKLHLALSYKMPDKQAEIRLTLDAIQVKILLGMSRRHPNSECSVSK